MPKKTKKVKSLPARSLTSKQAKGVKGGLLPAVSEQLTQKVVLGDGSIKAVKYSKI